VSYTPLIESTFGIQNGSGIVKTLANYYKTFNIDTRNLDKVSTQLEKIYDETEKTKSGSADGQTNEAQLPGVSQKPRDDGSRSNKVDDANNEGEPSGIREESEGKLKKRSLPETSRGKQAIDAPQSEQNFG
jgi:hypothetical protein